MASLSTAFVFIGIMVLALAIIALVVWVALLSSRLRKLTDWMISQTELGQQPSVETPQQPFRGMQPQPSPQHPQPQPPQQYPQPQSPQPRQQPTTYPSQEATPSRVAQPMPQVPQADAAQPQPGPGNAQAPAASAMASDRPQQTRTQADQSIPQSRQAPMANSPFHPFEATHPTTPGPSHAGQPGMHARIERYDDDYDYGYDEVESDYGYEEAENNFFDGYRTGNVVQSTTSFGRATPSIPFGDDKDLIEKRESYLEDAISSDFDPDSIDFSRVAGYKDKQQP